MNPFLMFSEIFDKIVAVTVCMALVCAPIPASHAAASDTTPARASDTTRPEPPPVLTPPSTYFLRDAVPSAGFSVEPEDTTDDYFLPEEKDTKKLVWEIAAWVVGAAIVAFFIIKVFIEEDEPDNSGGDGGKDEPPS